MKLLTRDTDYAVRALCTIARSGKEKVSAAILVKDLAMPRPFLRKIMQALSREGIVSSYKGPGGGFAIAVEPKDISLAALMEIFQGPFVLSECSFKRRECPERNTCLLRGRLCGMESRISAELKSITIASLIR